MTHNYLVRTGAWGEIGGFRSVDATAYRRDQRVVCETSRGLEIGEVVSETDLVVSGRVLRPMTGEDELLQKRLERYKRKAVEKCREHLAEAGFDSILLEVEHLFDGRTLFFHFLGEVGPELETITTDLALEYEKNVRSRHFAKLLSEGCGPGCGTQDKGCSGGCAVCVVASACKTSDK